MSSTSLYSILLLLLACSFTALDGRELAADSSENFANKLIPSYSQLVVWGAWSWGGDLQLPVVPKLEQIFLGPRDLCASLSYQDDVTVVLKSNAGASRLSSFAIPEARQVAFNGYDIVALSKSGEVVSARNGGVLSHLEDVVFTSIYSSKDGSFAALSDSGRVSTWGVGIGQSSWGMSERATGGEVDDRFAAAALEEGVNQVFSLDFGFAALRNDSSLVLWGDEFDSGLGCPGERFRPPKSLFEGEVVKMLEAQSRFFALLRDGRALAWGCMPRLDAMLAHQELWDVMQIARTGFAFAALHKDGSVTSWGSQWSGGNPNTEAAMKLSGNVTALCGAREAFAALKDDGSVVAWGDPHFGGEVPADKAGKLEGGVVSVACSERGLAFAALKDNGSVVTWGQDQAGGDSSKVSLLLDGGVVSVHASEGAFAALREDGSVVTWGGGSGSNASQVEGDLSGNVTEIFAFDHNFVAVKAAGPGVDLVVQSGAQGRSSSSNKDAVLALIIGGVSVAVLCVALVFLAVFWRPVWCAATCDMEDQEAASSDDDNSTGTTEVAADGSTEASAAV